LKRFTFIRYGKYDFISAIMTIHTIYERNHP